MNVPSGSRATGSRSCGLPPSLAQPLTQALDGRASGSGPTRRPRDQGVQRCPKWPANAINCRTILFDSFMIFSWFESF